MLTRLINNTSVQALAYALLLSYIVVGIAVSIIDYQQAELHIAGYSFPFSQFWFEVAVVVFCPVLAWLFNVIMQNSGLIKGHYFVLPLFSIQLCLLAFISVRPDLLLAFPLLVIFFLILYNLTDAAEPLQHCFDLGFLLGLSSLILPQVLFLLPVIWLALITFGLFNFRTLIIPALGVFAFYFLVFAIVYFLMENSFFELLADHFADMGFGLHGMDFSGLWAFLPIGLILLVSIMEYTRAANHAKIRKRRFLNFNIGLLIYLIFCGAFAEDRQAIYSFLIFPICILQSNLLQYLRKWWMQDLVFVGIISSLLIALV